MSKRNDVQVKILKALLQPNPRIRWAELPGGAVGITDGYVMQVFPKDKVMIDLKKVEKFNFPVPEDVCALPLYCDSMHRIVKDRLGAVCRLDGEKGAVYVQQKYLEQFPGCRFYCEGPLQAVYAADEFGRLTGLMMPCRCQEF